MYAPRPIASVLVAASVAATLSAMPATAAAAVVRNPGDPAYVTHLRTGSLGHVWTGTHKISFTNLDAAPLDTIYLRLWSNGVRGCGHPQDSITISDLQGGTASEMLDCTEVQVVLDTPAAPGDRASLKMGLRIEVPEINDRFGFHGGLALMGTALPTLEVHDETWHHDPFIDFGESFYSIAGRYRVTLNTPDGLDTPTTGVVASRTTPTARRTVTTYVARDVRDFEWAAGRLRRIVGASHGTRVVVSYLPDWWSTSRARRMLHDAEASMDTFSASFGRFPYPEMDVVLTNFSTYSGMEYPTVIFSNPDRYTVSHELAHQWWFGIVGDNEFAEPWLDESFATWSQYLPFGGWKNCRRYHFQRAARITNDMAYWLAHPGEYGTIYGGGGCLLANLSHRFGMERFVRILHGYAARNWLGVARTAGFKAAIEKAAAKHLPGLDMDAYWDTWRVD
jgi:hypothetical protein